MRSIPYRLGFSSLHQESEIEQLPLQGKLPAWLAGTLIRTGPGVFEVGKDEYQHWFDGLAMLRKFSFENGRVSFANRFLESKAYLEAKAKGKISRGEFGTVARQSLRERLRNPIPRLTDNASVNITMLDDRYVSVTESPKPVVFEPKTLDTLGRFKYHDRVTGQITTAHPHIDHDRKTLFSYVTNLAPPCSYNIYSMDVHQSSRQLVSSVPVKHPAYMHSFSMTGQYIILTEYPFVLSRSSLLLSGKPFIENCYWERDRGTRILVINKDDGRLVTTCESEPFFSFHHVNAFEQDGEIALDVIAFSDASVARSLYLEPLRTDPTQVIAAGELRRYHVPLSGSRATYDLLSAEKIELPRINYPRCNMKHYRFVYGVGRSRPDDFTDQLVKVNVEDGSTQIWRSQNCYPGEPVFAAKPGASDEDDGAILSVVLDAEQGQSFLLVLDAQSFSEIARAIVPHHLPFDFHGQYFENVSQPNQYSHLHR